MKNYLTGLPRKLDEESLNDIDKIFFSKDLLAEEMLQNVWHLTLFVLFKNIRIFVEVYNSPQELMQVFEEFLNTLDTTSNQILKDDIFKLKDKEFIGQFEEIVKNKIRNKNGI